MGWALDAANAAATPPMKMVGRATSASPAEKLRVTRSPTVATVTPPVLFEASVTLESWAGERSTVTLVVESSCVNVRELPAASKTVKLNVTAAPLVSASAETDAVNELAPVLAALYRKKPPMMTSDGTSIGSSAAKVTFTVSAGPAIEAPLALAVVTVSVCLEGAVTSTVTDSPASTPVLTTCVPALPAASA